MDKQVSLYSSHEDNIGRPASFKDILLTQFATDLPAIIKLRSLDMNAADYKVHSKAIKAQLQAFTPAALMETKAKGFAKVLSPSGIMQLDFDYKDIKDYDIEELKRSVFDLPFIGFCGLSCSGLGFYALALIAEPTRLSEYATQCFEILKSYGVKPDETKGKKPENLRYLSYDANMLIRENPEPLHIRRFKTNPALKKPRLANYKTSALAVNKHAINKQLQLLNETTTGNRMSTIQKVSYTLGGFSDASVLAHIKNCIIGNTTFADDLDDFLKCAEDCFEAGIKIPFIK